MRRLTILQPYEARQFDQPPQFTQTERQHFFAISPLIAAELKKTRGNSNAIGLLLQYGYFRASGKFYHTEKFWPQDIKWVARQLHVSHTIDLSQTYVDRTRLNHKSVILTRCGYQPFSSHKALFCELTEDLVEKQLAPRKIVFSLVDLLRDKNIEVPQYDTFSKIIGETINRYEQNNRNKLEPLLTAPYRQNLMQLIDKTNETYQRPLLVGLKTISQSVKPKQIKRSMHGFLIIKKLYDEIEPLITNLGLSPEATRYYAQWVIKAKTTQLTGMTDNTTCCLYLLAFVAHQYQMWQDTLVDIVLKCTQQQLNKVEQQVNQIIAEKQSDNNALAHAVLEGYKQQTVSVQSVRDIIYNDYLTESQKVTQLKTIIPEKETAIDQKQYQNADKLAAQLGQDKQQKNFYHVLEKLSRKLQNRVADIIKHITLIVHDSHANLAQAIIHYQQNIITKTAPQLFLSDAEKRAVHDGNTFNAPLYKAILFVHVANGIKSGVISLKNSYRYMPIDAYLIKEEVWQRDRLRLLEKTNLVRFTDIDSLLDMLARSNKERFYDVNARITKGENPYIKVKKDGGFSVYTPALDKPDYESFADLIGRDRFVPILQMMAETNRMTKFTSCLTHHKAKGAHQPPPDETFFAGIFALGSNIGLHKLASTSLGVGYSQLLHCVNWYFSLDNLHEANNSLTGCMNKLWLPDQFKKEKQLLHTSSDAQKRCVSAESLNANFSYKYFGHGKGSNIYTFVDERGILFYTTVFSSAERDAAYVIDGLLHNDRFQSDMHSTDTHGYTDIIFTISHLMGVAFAPRLKNATSQVLVSFEKIRGDLANQNSVVLPKKIVDKARIQASWDTVLRLIATIKLHEHRASIIIKRLNSYTAEHPLQAAMKAFGQVIKTAFLLEYFNDVVLRQAIEKQLNKGELANKFSSAVAFANNQEIMQVDRDGQEVAAVCKMIIQNIIILWNYIELTKLIIRSDNARKAEILKSILSGSILAWRHANLLGTYDFRHLASQRDDTISAKQVLEYRAF